MRGCFACKVKTASDEQLLFYPLGSLARSLEGNVEQRPVNICRNVFAAWGARSLSVMTKSCNILENDGASMLLYFLIVPVAVCYFAVALKKPCFSLLFSKIEILPFLNCDISQYYHI